MLGYDFTLLRCALPVGWSRDHRRWSEAVCSHPRQSTAPNAGQRDALLPILATDALAAAQRGRDRAPPSDGLGGMAGVRRAREGPRGGWLWFFGKNRRSAGRDRSPRTQRRCRWSMVGGRIRRCRGSGRGAGQLASVLVTPTMGTRRLVTMSACGPGGDETGYAGGRQHPPDLA
jgi:hypothetical protein